MSNEALTLEEKQQHLELTYYKKHVSNAVVDWLKRKYPIMGVYEALYIEQCIKFFSDPTYRSGSTSTSRAERYAQVVRGTDAGEVFWAIAAILFTAEIEKYAGVVGMIRKLVSNDKLKWQVESASNFVGLFLAVWQETGMFSMVAGKKEEGARYIINNTEIPEDLVNLAKRKRHILPSLTPPVRLRTNNDSGYLTFNGSLILNDRYHNADICLDSLNIMNSVAFSITQAVVMNVQDRFKEKEFEEPKDRQKRLDNWEQLQVESAPILATLVNTGNKFYLTNRTCERGRRYARGFHFNTQGDDFRKGICELHYKEQVKVAYS